MSVGTFIAQACDNVGGGDGQHRRGRRDGVDGNSELHVLCFEKIGFKILCDD